MTLEQKKSLRQTLGNIEESTQELEHIEEQLQKEWDSMTGTQQEDNPDFKVMIDDIRKLREEIGFHMIDVSEHLALE